MQHIFRGALTEGIRGIDWILRHVYRVRPLSDNPECILRISPGRARRHVRLSDGASVRQGDSLANIHLWNERLSEMGDDSALIAWGAATLHRFRFSLQRLATCLRDDVEWREAVAVCGELSFVTDLEKAHRLFEALGFDLVVIDQPGLRIWRPAFWDNLFASWLMWAFNPVSLRGKRLADLARVQIWMSREQLLRRYSAPQRADRQPQLP